MARNNSETIQCLINPDWRELGHARVTLVQSEKKKVLAVSFLVDLFCLGVKSTMGQKLPFNAAAGFIEMIYFDGRPSPIPLDFAKDVVYGAIKYAKNLGFNPDPDFNDWKYALGDENEKPTNSIRFGDPDNNGKPLYVVGPEDPVDEIIATLQKNVGKDGFSIIRPED